MAFLSFINKYTEYMRLDAENISNFSVYTFSRKPPEDLHPENDKNQKISTYSYRLDML